MAEAEPGTNRLISRVRTKVPIPSSIPLRIGDCFQNLRSSLDYLVWELVLAVNNTPTNKHQFPICDKAEAFKDAVKRGRLKGISPEALAQIERLQPYHTRNGGALKLINDFANINKHRRMLLTVLSVVAAETEFRSALGKQSQLIIPSRDNAAHIGIGPPMHLAKEVHMHSQVALAIFFDEGAVRGFEVSQCLGVLIDEIGNGIIRKFERFFV